MMGTSAGELELVAEHITNSCRDIAEKVETDGNGKDHFTCLECDLYRLFCYKFISIFGDDALE